MHVNSARVSAAITSHASGVILVTVADIGLDSLYSAHPPPDLWARLSRSLLLTSTKQRHLAAKVANRAYNTTLNYSVLSDCRVIAYLRFWERIFFIGIRKKISSIAEHKVSSQVTASPIRAVSLSTLDTFPSSVLAWSTFPFSAFTCSWLGLS